MNNTLVSVVTPVYNSEKYISDCIESVLNQTFKHFEFIIVDDCSTDSTRSIVRQYQKQDNRISLVENSRNLGHFQNGNKAFDLISQESRFCKVLHADDKLYPHCIAKMVSLASNNPGVGVVSSYRLDGSEINLKGLPVEQNIFPGNEIARRYLLKSEYYFGSPSTLLLRSDLIRKRKKVYDETNIHADVTTCLDFLTESDFGFVHDVLSYTRRHPESVTQTVAKKYNTYPIGRLRDLVEYGPRFLNEREYQTQIHKHKEDHHSILASYLVSRLRFSRFIKHKREMEALDIPVNYPKLCKAVLFYCYKKIKRVFSTP